jgi:hypothetical protein
LSVVQDGAVETEKRSITVVERDLSRAEIRGNRDIGPSVIVDARKGRRKRKVRVLWPLVEIDGARAPGAEEDRGTTPRRVKDQRAAMSAANGSFTACAQIS